MCSGHRGWGRRQPRLLRHCLPTETPAEALVPCDPLGPREGPSCSGAASAVLMGCSFSVCGHTRGGPSPSHGAPSHPSCQGVTADPSLPRRCSCFLRTTPSTAERQRSPQRRGRNLSICTAGRRELPHMEPGRPAPHSKWGHLHGVDETIPRSSGTLPSQQRGFPACPGGTPSGNGWGMLLGEPPQGRGSPRSRASRQERLCRRGEHSQTRWEDSREGKVPRQRRWEEVKRAGGKAPKHAGNSPLSRSPPWHRALPQNFQNMLSTACMTQ